MGAPNTITRTCTPGDQVSGGCRWCGTSRKRLYAYNGTGHFCNIECFGSWNGERPEYDYIEFEAAS